MTRPLRKSAVEPAHSKGWSVIEQKFFGVDQCPENVFEGLLLRIRWFWRWSILAFLLFSFFRFWWRWGSGQGFGSSLGLSTFFVDVVECYLQFTWIRCPRKCAFVELLNLGFGGSLLLFC